MKNLFISEIHPPENQQQPAYWFVFQGEELLLQHSKIPFEREFPIPTEVIIQHQYLGRYQQIPCFAVQVNGWTVPSDCEFHGIRQAYTLLAQDDFFQLITRAKQVLFWDKNSQFCGACGQPTMPHAKDRAKQCGVCGHVMYPVVSPVMLTLIWRENEILLARPPHFIPEMYSILAGFAEPGETLEETVHREIWEEVGLTVKNLRYFGSQPWPFPSNLMLGFTAEYESGEIKLDKTELEDGRWFRLDALPVLPKPFSLSRKIIDWHLQRNQQP